MGDKEKSNYWYERAASQGNADGLAGLRIIKRICWREGGLSLKKSR